MSKLTGGVRLVPGWFKRHVVEVEYLEVDPVLAISWRRWRKAKVTDVYLLGKIIDKQLDELNPARRYGVGQRYQ